jgi:transcriptional regulator with PAS, ATPase and Fis domain
LGLTQDAIAAVQRYDWPGNVRELQIVLERAAMLLGHGDALVDTRHLSFNLPPG